MNSRQACRPYRGPCTPIPGRGCFGDLLGDEMVVSPPSPIVEPLFRAVVADPDHPHAAEATYFWRYVTERQLYELFERVIDAVLTNLLDRLSLNSAARCGGPGQTLGTIPADRLSLPPGVRHAEARTSDGTCIFEFRRETRAAKLGLSLSTRTTTERAAEPVEGRDPTLLAG